MHILVLNGSPKGEYSITLQTVRDHSMGARFEMYNDREFCNGHRTVTIGNVMNEGMIAPYKKVLENAESEQRAAF